MCGVGRTRMAVHNISQREHEIAYLREKAIARSEGLLQSLLGTLQGLYVEDALGIVSDIASARYDANAHFIALNPDLTDAQKESHRVMTNKLLDLKGKLEKALDDRGENIKVYPSDGIWLPFPQRGMFVNPVKGSLSGGKRSKKSKKSRKARKTRRN